MAASTKLEFILNLIDRVSGPTGKVMKSLDSLNRRSESAFRAIGYGAAGVAGAGYSLMQIVNPAREMNRSLGDVKSLGVGADVLKQLNSTALDFAGKYGESAAAFVSSSYDIQSAIAGLTGQELADFTLTSNLLAKGTKANASTITDFMGTMYGIFQKTADKIGKSEWVKQTAAQTAMAVNIFKSDGQKMAAAFENLGATATNAGVALPEQLAVLGQLQASMGGGEAATKYRAFLTAVGEAQDKLGLKFVDAKGKMLPMVDILARIKGKYGEINTVAKADLMKKAFGTDEAVGLLAMLITKSDDLKTNIKAIGEQKGLAALENMALARVDPFDKVAAGAENLKIVLGQSMIATLTPLLEKISQLEGRLTMWSQVFPNITSAIGKTLLVILGTMGAVGTLSIVIGLVKLMSVGWTAALWLLTAPFRLLIGLVNLFRLQTLATWLLMIVWRGSLLLLSGAFTVLRFGLLTVLPALLSFAAALLANPITWIVAGIAALVALVAYATGNWDAWTAALGRWFAQFAAFAGISAGVDFLLAKFGELQAWWAGFSGWLSNLNPFAGMGAAIDGLLGKAAGLFGLAGAAPALAPPVAGGAAPTASVPAGGISKAITTQINASRGATHVTVHNHGQPMSGQRLAREMAMAAP